MKKIIILIVVVLVGVGVYFITHQEPSILPVTQELVTTVVPKTQDDTQINVAQQSQTVIGKSVQGHDITAYKYGYVTGSKKLLFVGGIHGGYEWNTSLVAYNLMDYLEQHPEVIPTNVQVTVIPVLNPDGLDKVVDATTRFTASDVTSSQTVQISGRYNANGVDLNRNFDCDWQTTGLWWNTTVSGGDSVFSEPESKAMKQFVESYNPTAVVVWYSAAGGVYSSSCHNGILAETSALTKTYSDASGYPAYENFDFYATTGDLTNWLAKKNIPAISVLLTTHQDVEWNKNQAGIDALLQYYSK